MGWETLYVSSSSCLAHRELAWIFHEPYTGLVDCLRILLPCFRKRRSVKTTKDGQQKSPMAMLSLNENSGLRLQNLVYLWTAVIAAPSSWLSLRRRRTTNDNIQATSATMTLSSWMASSLNAVLFITQIFEEGGVPRWDMFVCGTF